MLSVENVEVVFYAYPKGNMDIYFVLWEVTSLINTEKKVS